MLRLTIVCSASTTLAPTTMGSLARCGWAPGPPLPVMRMSQRSAAASKGPGLVTMWPTGMPGLLWMGGNGIPGEFSEQAVLEHLARAATAFLGRLEDEVHGALEVALLAQHLGRTQQHGGVSVVAAGVH